MNDDFMDDFAPSELYSKQDGSRKTCKSSQSGNEQD